MGGTDECAARAHGCVPVRARDASVGDEPRDVVLGTLWADGVSICMATLEGRERDAVNEHARPSSRKHCCSIIRRGPAGPLRLPSTSPFARSVMVLRAALWTRPPLCVCVRFLCGLFASAEPCGHLTRCRTLRHCRGRLAGSKCGWKWVSRRGRLRHGAGNVSLDSQERTRFDDVGRGTAYTFRGYDPKIASRHLTPLDDRGDRCVCHRLGAHNPGRAPPPKVGRRTGRQEARRPAPARRVINRQPHSLNHRSRN
jgi:hypothetical protein